MKTLYESILSSTGTGKTAIIKAIENCEFTPELVKMLENTVAIYKVKSSDELNKLMWNCINIAGNECSLNWIDTSKVTNMDYMFSGSDFNGNISKWNVSNVIDMSHMFDSSNFNGNISDWNVSKVRNMASMFAYSDFNGNISKWNVSNVTDMYQMFCNNKKFNQDISKWDVKNVNWYGGIFNNCPIKENYKPKFR